MFIQNIYYRLGMEIDKKMADIIYTYKNQVYGNITNKLSYAILEDRVTVQQYKKFIMILQNFFV